MSDDEGYGCAGMVSKLMFKPTTILFLTIIVVLGVVAMASTEFGKHLREQTAGAELAATPVPANVKARGCLPAALLPLRVIISVVMIGVSGKHVTD